MVTVIIIAVIILLPPIVIYNGLIIKRNQVRNVFASTDALLKKRFDLLPNLVETVKGYMQHERQVFEKITEIRAKASGQSVTDNEKVELDNQLKTVIGRLMAAVENYPQLKASGNFLHLQRTLNELEEQISAARRAYNASVTDYNNAVQTFPTNIIASIADFRQKELFRISDHERQNADAGSILKN